MHGRLRTEVWQLADAAAIDEAIRRAAQVLCDGGLVAFPTETVYGLGANALDAAAVARIFVAKGRPAGHPLIVHVPGESEAQEVVADWPPAAHALAQLFWPGPLTLVLPRHGRIASVVTGGGPTVGVRVPAHPIAQALLRQSKRPIAAPSANLSTQISPTRPEHVLAGLGGRFDLLLAAGPTPGGIESTVLDVSVRPCRLLRPGLISATAIEAVVGPVERVAHGAMSRAAHDPLPSPGLAERHYAPRAILELASDDGVARVEHWLRQGVRVGWMCREEAPLTSSPLCIQCRLPDNAAAYAARLYDCLHDLDAAGAEHIVVAAIPADDEWMAIRDRLGRAAFRPASAPGS